jgi:hypothetical protein
MASAWGDSWGSAWGDSWGVISGGSSSASDVRARNNLLGPADKIDNTLQPRLYEQLEQLLKGRSRNASTVTLESDETETTVEDPLFESHQTVHLTPMSAEAAAAMTTTYISARSDGSFTITHASASDSLRTFGYTFTG